MKGPNDYRCTLGVEYEQTELYAYCCLPVLQVIWGRKWDQDALNVVGSLRPSYIRVTNGEEKCDARPWRVTVTVDDNDTIECIHQEVIVGCEGRDNGSDVMQYVEDRCDNCLYKRVDCADRGCKNFVPHKGRVGE
jgi:hypothetical protein